MRGVRFKHKCHRLGSIVKGLAKGEQVLARASGISKECSGTLEHLSVIKPYEHRARK